jgi:hypothetical protein
MLTKEQFLASCAHETRVIRHLATKVPPGGLDYRPTPQQRSTLELLRYLTSCAIVPARAMVTGSWDEAEAREQASQAVTPEEFDAEMERQQEELEALVRPIPDADFLERRAVLPWGAPAGLGEALLVTVMKTLVAYRMQLFLYAKAAGAHELGPSNCWVGVDRRPPAAQATA